MSYFLDSQDQLDFKVTAETLGPDDLLLQTLRGTEELSKPFSFRVTFQSENNAIPVETLIGKGVTIEAKFNEGSRYFHGILGQFIQGDTAQNDSDVDVTFYHATLYPTLWKMRFASDCRIFQHQSAIDIIKAVLSENGVVFQDKTQGGGSGVRAYCVQYNETHFDFVSRLMEAEGIFYFFTFESGSHCMVLADDYGAHKKCPMLSTVEVDNSAQEIPPFHKILASQYQAQLVTSDFQHADYDYKKPSTTLVSAAAGGGPATFGKWYEYPGDFLVGDDGDGLANIHLQESEALKITLSGTSTAPFFTSGHKFGLKKHARDDLNQDYILHSVTHAIRVEPSGQASGTASYQNTFVAFLDQITFRAPRITPKPRIHGTQTALVTGKGGEEIWTDQYGRIKVKFHWDQTGTADETSSCWIRVAQGWASSGWGVLFTPRMGMEVVVSFICGDPDRPLVTGVVYNGDHLPPYLPDEPTKSTIYTNTTKGGSGYNEIRFEDKAGSEEIWVHAQKDMNIDVVHDRNAVIETGDDTLDIQKGNRITTIKHDDTKTLNDGDETILIEKGDRSITLNKGDESKLLKKGDRSITLNKGDESRLLKKGDRSITLNKGSQSTLLKKGDRSATLNKGDDSILLKKGSRTITLKKGDETKNIKKGDYTRKVKGNYTLTVGGNMTIKVKGDILIKGSKTYTLKTGLETTLKAGKDILVKSGTATTMKAGTDLTAKAGANATVKAGAMGTVQAGSVQVVKGALVKIN